MKQVRQNNRSGNWVAFLSGAIINILIGISLEGVTESEWNILLGGAIGGLVWMLVNKVYERIRSV